MSKSQTLALRAKRNDHEDEDIETPAGLARGNGWSDQRSHVDLFILGPDNGTESYSNFSAELSVSRSTPTPVVSISCLVHYRDGTASDPFGDDGLKPHEVEPFFLLMAALLERARMDGILHV